jgi:drug/metabolite transporter (DMT)-like permease
MELTLPVTLAVLGAAALHAGWNVLEKSGGDKDLETVAIAVGSGAIGLVLLPLLPAPSPASWPWLAGSALVHILYFAFLAGAYRHGELSFAYPVMRGGGPMIVALAGTVFMNETLSLKSSLSIVLICAGIIAFASGAHDRRATAYAVANAAVIGAYTLIDAQGARASGAPVSYTLWFFAANGAIIGAYGLARRGADVTCFLRRSWLRTAVGGACAVGAYAIALWAMTRAPVALVAVLRETSVVFAALIAFWILKEKLTRRRMLATAMVLLGLVALRL